LFRRFLFFLYKDSTPQKEITLNICGNGIIEANEECDCGPPDGLGCSGNTACDPHICKLMNNAKCDPFNMYCCSNNEFLPKETVCRESKDPCQLTQYCSGDSGHCNVTHNLPDLTSCRTAKNKEGTCASGICTSRSLQCALYSNSSTKECPFSLNECNAYCTEDPSSMNCVYVNHQYRDGTPCAWKGVCQNGKCNDSLMGLGIGYYMSYLAYSIAATIVILVLIMSFIYSKWKNSKRRRMIESQEEEYWNTLAENQVAAEAEESDFDQKLALHASLEESERSGDSERYISESSSSKTHTETIADNYEGNVLKVLIPSRINAIQVGQSSAVLKSTDITSAFERRNNKESPSKVESKGSPKEKNNDHSKND
jgi:hypothetical protein